MSNGWDAYIDTQLVGTGNVKEAAICSNQDDSIWAASEKFKPSPEEIKVIREQFDDPEYLAAHGLKLCGSKYFYIGGDNNVVRLKLGSGGAIIVKTDKTFLIATYDSSIQPGQCSNTVQVLGDYLKETGY